ncbi:MAG: serine hydrolase, partial [Candidatus Obscuribacterales bacterium]
MALEAPEKTKDAVALQNTSRGFSLANLERLVKVKRFISVLKHTPTKKISVRKRKRKLPPGQRLLRAVAAAMLLSVGQGLVHPLISPCESTTGGAQPLVPLAAPFALTTPLTNLRDNVQTVCQVKKLTPGVFAIDPATGAYLDFNGNNSFSAASMIKVPVLVALLSAIDSGDIDANQIMSIKP